MTGCTNVFFEDDGYCTACGEYHKRGKRTDAPTYAVKEATPVAGTEASVKQVVRETLDKLIAIYGIACGLKFTRGMRGRAIHNMITKEHRFVLGVPRLLDDFETGFKEYTTVAPLVGLNNRDPLMGMDAVKQTVYHEYAHVLQVHRGLYKPRGDHDLNFVKCYREVMKAMR